MHVYRTYAYKKPQYKEERGTEFRCDIGLYGVFVCAESRNTFECSAC